MNIYCSQEIPQLIDETPVIFRSRNPRISNRDPPSTDTTCFYVTSNVFDDDSSDQSVNEGLFFLLLPSRTSLFCSSFGIENENVCKERKVMNIQFSFFRRLLFDWQRNDSSIDSYYNLINCQYRSSLSCFRMSALPNRTKSKMHMTSPKSSEKRNADFLVRP